MLSHEIRTPLTSIRESVNLIGEEVMGAINDRQRRFLEIASLELERISNLLNHLMQVSRIEVGALKIMPHPMDPGELVQESLYRILPAAEAKGVTSRPSSNLGCLWGWGTTGTFSKCCSICWAMLSSSRRPVVKSRSGWKRLLRKGEPG
jgi:signal transduction histidine kinase